jgi:hypothetical protein
MRRRDVKIAAAVLLIAGGFVIGMWLWNDSSGRQAEVRRRVYEACSGPLGVFKSEEVRAIGPDAVPYLIEMLRVQDGPTRRLGVKIGKKLPARLRQYWPDLPDPEQLHYNAARMLNEFGPTAKPAVPDLIRILETEKITALFAVDAFEAIGPDAAAALPALHAAWTNQDKLFRYHVAGAIWSVGRETNAVLNFCLAELPRSNDGFWSVGMASQLDESSRKTFAAALMGRLQDAAHPKAHDAAAVALGRLNITDETIQRALLQGAKDSDQELRCDCATALSKLWPTNTAFTALGIRAFLESAEAQKLDFTQVNFCRYAHYTGVDLDAAHAALKECLNDDDPKIRAPAAKALALLEASKPCALALSKLDPTNAAFAALSIRYVLEAQKPGGTSSDIIEGVKYSWVDRDIAIAALKEYLNDDDHTIRTQAANALPFLEASKSLP